MTADAAAQLANYMDITALKPWVAQLACTNIYFESVQ